MLQVAATREKDFHPGDAGVTRLPSMLWTGPP